MTTSPTNPWSLIALSPELGDLSVPLGVSTSVGRHQDNDIVLATQQISRHHAKFNQIGSNLFVQDLGSSNGTFVNGERITTEAVELGQGDEVGFADILFMVANEALLALDTNEHVASLDWQSATATNTASTTIEVISKAESETLPETLKSSVNDTETNIVTEVVPLPATIISSNESSPNKSTETSTIVQPQPDAIKSPTAEQKAIETITTPVVTGVIHTATASTQPVSDSTTIPKPVIKTNSIDEQAISPLTPTNTTIPSTPSIPKKAPTQTWLVAIIIVILIVLAIIGTLFLK